MKILHTADWHLGHRLMENERKEEHQHFLNFLLNTLKEGDFDALIIAGDVFDTGNPPIYARSMYYDFLSEARMHCPHIIVLGGNHDSVSMINAPKQLLTSFNVYVLGGATLDLNDEIIQIKDKKDNIIGVVAAVPFLRDQDIRQAVAGESYQERVEKTQSGIRNHYAQIRELVLPYKAQNIPIIACGHLYASGSELSDSEKDIHVGNQAQVGADVFAMEFDYVALGHIHKPQLVNKKEHIRYSGSPIQLSFKEKWENKQVLSVEFENGVLKNIESIPFPVNRKLYRLEGDLETVKEKLQNLELPEDGLKSWGEVIVKTNEQIPNLNQSLRDLIQDKNIDLLKIQLKSTEVRKKLNDYYDRQVSLSELKPKTVFETKLESANINEDDKKALIETFNELQDWMNERKDE